MEKPSNERLASLEAKMEILLDLLKEIRNDLKTNPTREEFTQLRAEVEQLQSEYAVVKSKVATVSGAISIVVSILTAIAVKLLVH